MKINKQKVCIALTSWYLRNNYTDKENNYKRLNSYFNKHGCKRGFGTNEEICYICENKYVELEPPYDGYYIELEMVDK